MRKDRRKKHRIEADEKLAELLAKQSLDGGGAERPAVETAALMLGDLSKGDRDLRDVLKTARVFMDVGEPLQASEMLADCITHLTRKWQDR